MESQTCGLSFAPCGAATADATRAQRPPCHNPAAEDPLPQVPPPPPPSPQHLQLDEGDNISEAGYGEIRAWFVSAFASLPADSRCPC